MKVPRLGVELELQLPAYTTAEQLGVHAVSVTYTVAHSNARSFNPLSEVGAQTCVFMDTSWIRFCCTTTGTPMTEFFKIND